MALPIIDHCSSIKTGIRDYAAISKPAHVKYVAEIEVSASSAIGGYEPAIEMLVSSWTAMSCVLWTLSGRK